MIIGINIVGCRNTSNANYTQSQYSDIDNDTLLSFSPSILSLGTLDSHSKDVEPFTFKVYNKGDSILRIDKVDVSCSCIVITSYPSTLPIGHAGVVNGYITLKNQYGHLRKTIFMKYNISKTKTIKIVADIAE